MNCQSSNFEGEESSSENIKKDLKVEVSLKIQMVFLSFVNMKERKGKIAFIN